MSLQSVDSPQACEHANGEGRNRKSKNKRNGKCKQRDSKFKQGKKGKRKKCASTATSERTFRHSMYSGYYVQERQEPRRSHRPSSSRRTEDRLTRRSLTRTYSGAPDCRYGPGKLSETGSEHVCCPPSPYDRVKVSQVQTILPSSSHAPQ